ncbi:hypothetical protein HY605_05355 [Candidatus Peregrinibacteria bacterium]|nr:hypothetical protein [Candidatus Peregrinibacteria bacterium]
MPIQLKESLDDLIKSPCEFTGDMNFASKIHIYDETIRDGEQMPGVAFSPEQKLEIAEFLSDLGVDVILPAFIVSSESDREAYRKILKSREQGRIRREVEVLTIARANTADIDLAAKVTKELGVDLDRVGILILSTASDLHLKYKLGQVLLKYKNVAESEWLSREVSWYRQANLDFIAEHLQYAQKLGFASIEFASEDASRSSLDYLLDWATVCKQAGGTRLCFSDTCGVLTPEAVDYYFPPLIKKLGGLDLTAHFHNDFGLAAINTVRALSHGATHASITACGIGERAGNGSIHQIVMILKELYGVELPGFRYDQLWKLRNLIEQYSGILVQAHEPIIGNNVFSHESGIHTAGISIHPAIYQFIDERIVGGEHKFVYGKHSGKAGLYEFFRKSGIKIDEELLDKVLADVKDLREKNVPSSGYGLTIDQYYGHINGLGISESQILAILNSYINS